MTETHQSIGADRDRLRGWLVTLESVAADRGEAVLCRLAGEAIRGDAAPDIGEGPVRQLGVLPGVNINITDEIADRWDGQLSDFLCWAAGYNAALGPDQLDRSPLGVETIRQIRETLTRSRRKAQETSK